MSPPRTKAGSVAAIWRYPVKSMRGEELDGAELTLRGVLGDRGYALIDAQTLKAVTAKNPRRWPGLLRFRSRYLEPPRENAPLPPVQITLPGGATIASNQPDVEEQLSRSLGRAVRLAASASGELLAEGYWPDQDWLPQRDEVFDFPLPPGTFFDAAAIHLLTTATLGRLRELAPAAKIEVPRFRPNLVIDTPAASAGFGEDAWIGRTLEIGSARLRIDGPCPRCVMTTLEQDGLPQDPEVMT